MSLSILLCYVCRAAVQNGEANSVLDAAVEVIDFFKEDTSIGVTEVLLIVCKLHVCWY